MLIPTTVASPKIRPKKTGLMEVLAASSSSNPTFNPVTVAPKTNIFNSLTDDEAASSQTLRWDNAIEVVDLVQPNKTDALNYLDHGGPVPARFAVARIAFGATKKPYVQDFIVGRSPFQKPPRTRASIGPPQAAALKSAIIMRIEWRVLRRGLLTQWNLDVTPRSLNYRNGSDDDDFDIWGIDPLWMEEIDGEQRVVLWNTYWRYPSDEDAVFDGETLLPQGLYFKSDITGRDSSKWKVLGWLYGDIFYSTTAEFRKAWKSPGFVKYELNLPGEWIGSDQTGPHFPADDIAPPVAVQPNGQRFSICGMDGFLLYITFTRDTGLRLFDIKYKGERIIYELGLQEAIAHYAGNDPVQSGTAYMDTFYGFVRPHLLRLKLLRYPSAGPYAFELVPGYDCPTYSHFLNSTFHAAEISTTHRNNICLFESDPGYLMQRHSSSNYLALTKNIVFTLRSVSTVGNYDYSFDYIFALDGSIETIVRASGYIQSAYYAKNNNYGYQVHDALSGSMHDHVLNWKVDMDVLGTENTFVKHKIVPVEVKYPWANKTRSTMHLERVRVQNEDDAKLSWPQNGADMFLVENSDKPNKYGEPRGYKIAPSRGGAGMHLTIENSPNLLKSQGFAKHALYVTKQKDTEVRASHANNDYDPGIPLSISKNSSTSEPDDIVLWINLGMHMSRTRRHAQHWFTMPNPRSLSPHPANGPNRLQLLGVQLVKEFGGKMASGVVNIPNFWNYEGDVAVRKFPYDPLHPFNDTESIV
ncbi:putative copper amine oxidase [Mycena leptocephala]|nr:putative copper amine oxidase [Mycena leptocephala]